MRIAGIIALLLIVIAVLLATKMKEQTQSSDKNTLAQPEASVVCYAALDEEFSKPLLQAFEKKTGIRVDMVFDTESTKTIGLVNRIKLEHEQGRPRCDVFWNNEIMNTIRLKNSGALASYRPEAAKDFPDAFKDPAGTWTGFAARARVLIVNTTLVKKSAYPQRLSDLEKETWKGKIGIAKPLFGSTATWVTTLFANKSERGIATFSVLERMAQEKYFRILGGNKSCAQAVSNGTLAMAFTDTDDAVGEKESGKPVDILYLDGGEKDSGCLFFPNTLSVIQGCPHPNAARALVEYLLSPEVETALAKGPSAQIPINPAVTLKLRVATPKTVNPMRVNWDEAAKRFDKVMEWSRNTFNE